VLDPEATGNGDRHWVRVFAERAPELLAIVIIVGMFLYHLGETAKAGVSALARVEQVLSSTDENLNQVRLALQALSEQGRSALDTRRHEHDAILHEIDELRAGNTAPTRKRRAPQQDAK
jgi:hypothetical protein